MFTLVPSLSCTQAPKGTKCEHRLIMLKSLVEPIGERLEKGIDLVKKSKSRFIDFIGY